MKPSREKLFTVMAKKCYGVNDLAKKATVSAISISKFQKVSSPKTVGKIARALNVDVEDLLED